jgi:hypothetical protein
MPILEPADLTKEIEGTYYSPKMQWWCAHADLVDDDGHVTAFYFWPALGSLDEAWICSLHTADELIDLTSLHNPLGTFTTSRSGVDVQFGNQYIRGTYPEYEIHVEGTHDGQPVALTITMKAEIAPYEALPNLRGITWHYVPKFAVTGTLTVRGVTTAVSGGGYLERRRGRFWTPGINRGLWESITMPGGEQFSIPLFYKVWKNDDSPTLQTLCYTLDGQSIQDLGEVDVEVLETIRYDERIDHPIRFRVAAEGENCRARLNVTRNPNRLALRDFWGEPDPTRRAVGIYGTGHMEAVVEDAKGRHETSGASFGSALYFWAS